MRFYQTSKILFDLFCVNIVDSRFKQYLHGIHSKQSLFLILDFAFMTGIAINYRILFLSQKTR